jgi:uncharacterized glyoxalase superfamily protein PhnB
MERAIPILPMEDVEAAKTFYVNGLGFHVVFEASYPYDRGDGTIIGLERGNARLHLDYPMPGHGRDACVYLDVNDADTLYQEWQSRVEIRRPPENQPWGSRTFDVIDPFGNTLFVVGPTVDNRSGVIVGQSLP